MAYINASSAVNRVKLVLIHQADMAGSTPVETDFYTAASNTTGAITTVAHDAIVVPGLQDVTINNANGSFRWKQLDQSGENVITTNATNSLSGNFVLDPNTFFGSGTGGGAGQDGIFKLSNDRVAVNHNVIPNPEPGIALSSADNGGYTVHPPDAGPVSMNIDVNNTTDDMKKNQ